MRMSLSALLPALFALSTHAADPAPAMYGPELEGFDYPYPVQHYAFQSQGEKVRMAYLDVRPAQANGRTVVVLHGKNFCAATWETSIAALAQAGYRVIAPDQIGFCKSSKPAHHQYSLHELAANTHALLESIGIDRAAIVGHSMGGMLAARYALMYPQASERLLLVNPIGLEDWKALGVPWRSVDGNYARELKTTAATIKQYQQTVYYGGQWKPEYQRWVDMLAGLYAGPGRERVAWNQALSSDMVFTQPVVHELPNLRVPTTLFIGQRDRTAINRDLASDELKARLGLYPRLGRAAARAIPGATLIEFEDLGHSPQVEAPQRFNAALLDRLNAGR
ncbi:MULTISPECIES: alpha/beta hydrolase [unclassified Lysobacter]|uniref:alpha/beta fold hydrolase n=1 Tax=unclassified Lysobacter TaxID=2635362 RepID=UPI001BEC5456|nr:MULTISPECIES: alpha/beta hydrolase [unclassified Lysobacter]MBT2749460.1 alpha/beta hydrolase [Lysobacter sp. ISL-42]MBT2753962.1 alpha/beta hydrolase [Lysobacter sp. ISL-50]MBT2778035.1 alpha/beta hydrolase [Lysobacter sp. ISL-54]MBT2780750.1 alpha/beta hydrolase [Lysobacter sp. ISL-52]